MATPTTATAARTDWYKVSNVDDVSSPALLVYPERVEENIRRMIQIAGDVNRLRPHMKTNKLPEVIRMQMAQGIMKYKCATIAEAEVAAACSVPDVMLAYQPVGPNVRRLVHLVQKFPATRFSALSHSTDGTVRACDLNALTATRTPRYCLVYVSFSPLPVLTRSRVPSGFRVISVAAPGEQEVAGSPTVTVDGPISNGPSLPGDSVSAAWNTQW